MICADIKKNEDMSCDSEDFVGTHLCKLRFYDAVVLRSLVLLLVLYDLMKDTHTVHTLGNMHWALK